MKHIALVLAVVIFAFSFASCGDLTYYAESDWEYSSEEFFGEPFENINSKILDISEKYGFEFCNTIYYENDSCKCILIYDDVVSFIIKFDCEDLWCVCEIEIFFFGEDENDLADYEKQKKYIDFINDVKNTLVYNYENQSNLFKESFEYCVANEVESYDSEHHFDAMVGELTYGVLLNTNEYGYRYKFRGSVYDGKACNYYHFRGLLRGDFEAGLAS